MRSGGLTFTLLLGIGLFFDHVGTTELDEETKEKINAGVSAGVEILEVISSPQFATVLGTAGSIARKLGPYGTVISSIVNLVLVFIPGIDPEEAFRNEVREQFKIVNDKLELIIDEVNKLESMVKWTVKKDRFDTHATKIYIASKDLARLANSSSPDAAKADMLNSYNNNYEDSGDVLLAMILGRASEASMVDLFVEYTEYDRALVQKFMKQCLSFLTQAMQVEVAMLAIENVDQGHIEDKVRWWREEFSDVQTKFENVDKAFSAEKAKEIDIPPFIREKRSELSSTKFSSHLYDLLKKKYYWYEWFVVLTDVVSESRGLAVGGKQYWTFGDFRQDDSDRQLYVAYQESTSNDSARQAILQRELENYRDSNNALDQFCSSTAEKIFRETPTDVSFKLVVWACSYGFVPRGDGAAVANVKRCSNIYPCHEYHIAAFGTGKTTRTNAGQSTQFITLPVIALYIWANILL